MPREKPTKVSLNWKPNAHECQDPGTHWYKAREDTLPYPASPEQATNKLSSVDSLSMLDIGSTTYLYTKTI